MRLSVKALRSLTAAGILALMLTACGAPDVPETTAETAALETTPETAALETTCETAATEPTQVTLPALPEDYDLPVSQVPEKHPDLHNIASIPYEETPTLTSPQALSAYLLNRFLNGQFKLEFCLARELAPNEGEATGLVLNCVEAAQTAYPFGAWREYNNYIEEIGDPDRVKAVLELRYENPGYDQEARAEALEYVLKHPVPVDGFRDSAQEREYCRGIHDYIIGRISYDPIGFGGPEDIRQSQYDNKQEAYNSLASEETTAVCAGYARGFALIAQYAGIDCFYIKGNEKTEPVPESHAWNVIYPCGGEEPVVVDVTWDDPDITDRQGRPVCDYTYFYLPVSEDREHTPHMESALFLDWLHGEAKEGE